MIEKTGVRPVPGSATFTSNPAKPLRYGWTAQRRNRAHYRGNKYEYSAQRITIRRQLERWSLPSAGASPLRPADNSIYIHLKSGV
jgi:hypothetical protein